MELERYKIVVNVVMGEKRGEGCRMNCRCFWDADSDNMAHEVYSNVRIVFDEMHVPLLIITRFEPP